MKEFCVLSINPGSTSTKTAAFLDQRELFSCESAHDKTQLADLGGVQDQLALRREAVRQAVAKHGGEGFRPQAVSGRGGLLRPLPGGVYAVTQAMLTDLAQARHGEHPCNLGAPLAMEFATHYGCPAFVVDPPVTDELRPVARLTGLPYILRRSVFHALSQRAAARRAAQMLGLDYAQSKFVVAHLGGGISVGAHDQGRVVDVTNGVDGEGPLTPERVGSLPAFDLLDLVEAGHTPAMLRKELLTQGGLYAHLGTNDLRQAQARAQAGDPQAALLVKALEYNIAKYIAAMSAPLFEETGTPINAVVLTGGMARSQALTQGIERRVRHLAPVLVLPEVEEMRALAEGAQRALQGLEPVLDYF